MNQKDVLISQPATTTSIEEDEMRNRRSKKREREIAWIGERERERGSGKKIRSSARSGVWWWRRRRAPWIGQGNRRKSAISRSISAARFSFPWIDLRCAKEEGEVLRSVSCRLFEGKNSTEKTDSTTQTDSRVFLVFSLTGESERGNYFI